MQIWAWLVRAKGRLRALLPHWGHLVGAYSAGGALRCHKGLKSGSLWYVSRRTSFPQAMGRRAMVRWAPHAIVLLRRRHLWCHSSGTGVWWSAFGSPHQHLLGVSLTFTRGGSHMSHSGPKRGVLLCGRASTPLTLRSRRPQRWGEDGGVSFGPTGYVLARPRVFWRGVHRVRVCAVV